jgi:amino acid transporter
MATSTAHPPAGRSRPGLRRDIGFVGLIWASEGSIIGSGRLFGAQGALSTAGPAAIISWVIGGVAILILALTHAELGGMYAVSGGTARLP